MKIYISLRNMAFPQLSRFRPIAVAILAAIFLSPVFADDLGQQNVQDETAAESRLKQTVEYLASNELQGRGPGTEGIDKAADYIAKRMGNAGLKTDLFQGTPYQSFDRRALNYEFDLTISIWPDMWGCIGFGIYDLFLKNDDLPTDNKSFEKYFKPMGGADRLKNVVALLEAQGPLAEETIVIGAHYDHIGELKTYDGEVIAVYHGANDNASGVAVMLETAEILAKRPKKLPRRVLFVAFSGEELGMQGSFHYVNHPLVPLDKTIAMINLDVVGRMQGDKVLTMGTSTSRMLAEITGQAARQRQLNLIEIPWVITCSDHVAFHERRIPTVFLMTHGGLSDIHKSADLPNTLNYPGMRKIAQVAADLTVELAEADQRPRFSEGSVIVILFRDMIRLLAPSPAMKN